MFDSFNRVHLWFTKLLQYNCFLSAVNQKSLVQVLGMKKNLTREHFFGPCSWKSWTRESVCFVIYVIYTFTHDI